MWIKTIGQLTNDESPYYINFRNKQYCFEINRQLNGYDVVYDISLNKENPVFVKLLKNVFRKAASCVLCRECEADCHNGFINMSNGVLEISNKCTHCAQCHKVEKDVLYINHLKCQKEVQKC